MKQYTTAFQARVLQPLVGPRAISAYRVASDVGVSQVTRSRWLAAARSVPDMTTPAKQWTGAQKLRGMMAAHALSETELGALLRRQPACTLRGLSVRTVERWRGAHPAMIGTARAMRRRKHTRTPSRARAARP